MQGKYLKRLYELQEAKRNIGTLRESMHLEADKLRSDAEDGRKKLVATQESYLGKQRLFASKLVMKNGKRISAKVTIVI